MPREGRRAGSSWGSLARSRGRAALDGSQLADIAHVIQLSIAPVFLLTGVAAFLGVLTNRLGRIIDRARALEAMLGHASERERTEAEHELGGLSRRARLVNRAIALATICALLTCAVIALLFAGTFLGLDVRIAVSLAFVATMFALTGALLTFLREVFVATRHLRIGAGTTGA
jgi:hypothetical protein